MNMTQIRHDFWQQGYVELADFFDSDLMDELQNIIVQHYADFPEFAHSQEFLDKSATDVIPWFPQQEGVKLFDKIEQDQRLTQLSRCILGKEWKTLYCMAMFSQAQSKGQAWHQDCPSENVEPFNLNRLVYTLDVGGEVGGEVVVMPGSHKVGELSAGRPDEDFKEQVVLTPQKGTLVIIHGHTWHRVLPVKNHYRVSTNFRAVPEGTADNITDICVYRNMRYQFSTGQVLKERLRETS
jgi:ectoine hydroxylase-related dioxygenase (phytanoyl-CoA dioxygenase family)